MTCARWFSEALQASAISCRRTVLPWLTAQDIRVRIARFVRAVSRICRLRFVPARQRPYLVHRDLKQIIRGETILLRGGFCISPGITGSRDKGQFRRHHHSKRFGYCIPNKSSDYLYQDAGRGAGLCNRFESKGAIPAPGCGGDLPAWIPILRLQIAVLWRWWKGKDGGRFAAGPARSESKSRVRYACDAL
jgi:hypothetical protein